MNVARVDVMSEKVYLKDVVSKDNKPYKFREQDAYIHLVSQDGTPEPVPVKISISLEGDAKPYPIGTYELSLRSLIVSGFNRLQVARVRLDAVGTFVERKGAKG